MKSNKNINAFKLLIGLGLIGSVLSCAKWIEVDPPIDKITVNEVYGSSGSATSALIGVYFSLTTDGTYFGGERGISANCGLVADEFNLSQEGALNGLNVAYYTNALSSTRNAGPGTEIWSSAYRNILNTNSVIEGVAASKNLSDQLKKQLIAEAKFLRAFLHSYLVELYGDVPIVITTDYTITSMLPRSPKTEVYTQIIKDLTEAKEDLTDDYVGAEKTRANKSAAIALLAREYLYAGQWQNAEDEASKLIVDNRFKLNENLNDVFLKNSKEAIWQLQPGANSFGLTTNTPDGSLFVPLAGEPKVFLSSFLMESFEPGDDRKDKWIKNRSLDIQGGGSITVNPYPFKYKEPAPTSPAIEYIMGLRLAEQYLIRAEARIRNNKVSAGISDLNVLRSRARQLPSVSIQSPLPAIQLSLSFDQALNQVLKERRIELFSEWGHRWVDLKRFGKIDEVMSDIASSKGAIWAPFKALFPIPETDLLANPNLKGKQNAGY